MRARQLPSVTDSLIVGTDMNTKLLIVDDHANTRELIRKFLDMPGLTFRECASGTEAVACAREFQPDWVTMDLEMPGLDGFDSTIALRQECPGARVMIVTSYNDPHFRQRAHAVGAVGYILKENILALRLMFESQSHNLQPPLSAPGSFGSTR